MVGLEVINRRLTLGALVAFEALVVVATATLATLIIVWDGFQYTDVLMGRMNDVIEPDPEQGSDRSALVQVPAITGQVSIRQVGFTFASNPDHPILSEASLEVAPGTRVAIVGRSGAGKTTLVKLWAGLQEPTSGRILYDGVDMSTLDGERSVGTLASWCRTATCSTKRSPPASLSGSPRPTSSG